MHKVQEQLLALADTENLAMSSYYSLAKRLGVANHGSIKFHLDQLLDKGLLFRDRSKGSICRVQENETFGGLISIPIMGEANCGHPTSIADGEIKDFLRVSPGILPHVKFEKLYALKAIGNSMNRADIQGRPIISGDYILVQEVENVSSGDYVVSIFDEVANVKRLFKDPGNARVLLVSESTTERPPIVVSEYDHGVYSIAGKVVGVVPGIGDSTSF